MALPCKHPFLMGVMFRGKHSQIKGCGLDMWTNATFFCIQVLEWDSRNQKTALKIVHVLGERNSNCHVHGFSKEKVNKEMAFVMAGKINDKQFRRGLLLPLCLLVGAATRITRVAGGVIKLRAITQFKVVRLIKITLLCCFTSCPLKEVTSLSSFE